MQILIGCAKIMTADAPIITGCTEPTFQHYANNIAMQIVEYSAEELSGMLHCNMAIAKENWLRYQHFSNLSTRRPAVFSYDGMVFQKIAPESMSVADLQYANDHLLIGSFLYGLLRPLDLINPYRLEGNVALPGNNFKSMFDFWKPILTNWLIDKVKSDDGILVNLASNEFRDIFDWKSVKRELTVITPDFKTESDGKLKTIVIYAKMCRGAMTRWIIQNRISSADDLRAFEYENFKWEGDYKFYLR